LSPDRRKYNDVLLGQICGALSSGVVTVFFAAVVDFWSARCGNVNNHSPRRYKTDLKFRKKIKSTVVSW